MAPEHVGVERRADLVVTVDHAGRRQFSRSETAALLGAGRPGAVGHASITADHATVGDPYCVVAERVREHIQNGVRVGSVDDDHGALGTVEAIEKPFERHASRSRRVLLIRILTRLSALRTIGADDRTHHGRGQRPRLFGRRSPVS